MDLSERNRREAGFNQVEILMGMVILLIVMAGVSSYWKYSVKASKKSDAYYVSSQIAAAALEEAKGDISNKDTLETLLTRIGDTTHTRSSSVTRQGKAFAVTVRFRKVAAGANLLRIKASVRWDGSRGNSMGTVYPYEP